MAEDTPGTPPPIPSLLEPSAVEPAECDLPPDVAAPSALPVDAATPTTTHGENTLEEAVAARVTPPRHTAPPVPPPPPVETVAGPAYAAALQERLQKIKAELEVQGETAVAMRRCVAQAEEQAEENRRELMKLRAQWASEQPKREALVREAGEAERKLATREVKVAEALAAQAQAHAQAAGEPPVPTIREEEPAAQVPEPRAEAIRPSVQLQDQRRRLAMLEEKRVQLSDALQELRDASRAEASNLMQTRNRNETLQKEVRSLRAGARAADERRAQALRKLEALDVKSVASQKKEHGLERQVTELREEVQELRSALSAAFAAARSELTKEDSTRRTSTVSDAPSVFSTRDQEVATWATNRQLEAKVAALQEDLRRKQAALEELRDGVPETSPGVSPAAAPDEAANEEAGTGVEPGTGAEFPLAGDVCAGGS